ncbi:MAG TPA: isocitrate/isopropylmalate dehydrogenase family protein [Methylomirabilota bacterium]|jgi:3-isopropylmalate dehydrogenase|nr:isocitrate/isopropylmalate dehydrogenase family protein [Methylomirabilota bacterium]
MPYYRIALIGGDGIGPEVVAEAARVLKAVEGGGLHFSFEEAEVGAALYRRTGEDLPRETIELCRQTDAILFGAAGLPDVRHADGTELVPQITLRMVLDLYAGVRPIKLFPGVPTPLALPEGAAIDYVIFRENTEGLFASLGGGSKVGEDLAVDTLVITRKGTERIVRRAFEASLGRAERSGRSLGKVTCVDKANVFRSYAFFRQVFQETARAFPGVRTDFAYIDAMTMYAIQAPWQYDVIVLENMFGDILSDLGAATVGGLGMAPSGDVGDRWALFQPSHGTAPDIAGKGMANPTATILSAAMMCRWLGRQHKDPLAAAAADRIEAAVGKALQDPKGRTPDIGGAATTRAASDAVIKAC